MKMAEFLAQTFTDETVNHMATLRTELLQAGLIRTFDQKYLYSATAKLTALNWYKNQLNLQDEKGSTGSYGKYFEVETRVLWSIARNVPLAINDIKARCCKFDDMRIKIDGKVWRIELKTGAGALAYGDDRVECLREFQALLKTNTLIVWDYACNGCPLCYKVQDLMNLLEQYNGDVATWFVWKDATASGRTQLNFQTVKTSKAKRNYLDGLQFDSYDWTTIRDNATFGE